MLTKSGSLWAAADKHQATSIEQLQSVFALQLSCSNLLQKSSCMKRFLAFSTLLVALWSLLIYAAMIAGHIAQAAHREAILRGFGLNACEAACWHGLEINKSTFAEVANTLQSDQTIRLVTPDPHSTCQFRLSLTVESTDWAGDVCVRGDTIREIYLRTGAVDSGFTVGDALAIWGAPESIVCANYIPDAPSYTAITLTFRSGVAVSVVRPSIRPNMLFDPAISINRIFYVQRVGFVNQYTHPWRGFITNALFKAGYCQQQTP